MRKAPLIALAVLCCLCVSAWGQLFTVEKVASEQRSRTVSTSTFELDGKPYTVDSSGAVSDPVKGELTLVVINSDAATIRFSAEDAQRNSATARWGDLGDGMYGTAMPGEYFVRVTVIDFEKQIFDEQSERIIVGGQPPPPPGPTPPGPTPPEPQPKVENLAVLILYESADLPRLPQSQRDIFYGRAMREWLAASTVPDSTGVGWRAYDNDTVFNQCTTRWCKMFGQSTHSDESPWLILADGDRIFWQGKLPLTVADTQALILKESGR